MVSVADKNWYVIRSVTGQETKAKEYIFKLFFDFSDISISCVDASCIFNACGNPFVLQFN